MRSPVTSASATVRWSLKTASALPLNVYGRTAAYRRICTLPLYPRSPLSSQNLIPASSSPITSFVSVRSDFLPRHVLFQTDTSARYLSSRSAWSQQAQKQHEPDVKGTESQANTKQSTPDEQNKESEAGQTEGQETSSEQNEGQQKEGEGKDKKDKPPPPPHGDKTPWQVFTETLKNEFQASKEWNEGTKQLSAGVNDFTQNPRVQKARNTYTQVTDAASTKTAEALKTTASAIGTGAAWTWDTAPVKGVRKVANVTGSGLEYVTRPVRKSKAFQAVKETVDDGSSSRYGGWIEKEERRRRRELRELNELERTGGKHMGPMEEDPK